MAQYTTYTTLQNDRWDLIADKAFGDSTRYPEIIALNPGVAIDDILIGGMDLVVPIVESKPSQDFQLPPWKR